MQVCNIRADQRPISCSCLESDQLFKTPDQLVLLAKGHAEDSNNERASGLRSAKVVFPSFGEKPEQADRQTVRRSDTCFHRLLLYYVAASD